MTRGKPPVWTDGEPPRSRDDLVALLKRAMSNRVHYLDASELQTLADGVLVALKRHGLRLLRRRPWTPPKPLAYASGTLADWRWPTVEVACKVCNRQGVYHRETLIARLGPDVPLPNLADAIAADCARQQSASAYDKCGVFLPQSHRAVASFNVRKPKDNHRR
jgi:hypothetical protein